MTLGSYLVNFGPFDLIFGPLWGFSVKIAFCNLFQFGADKNFDPIKKNRLTSPLKGNCFWTPSLSKVGLARLQISLSWGALCQTLVGSSWVSEPQFWCAIILNVQLLFCRCLATILRVFLNVYLPFCGCSQIFTHHSVGALKFSATILWVFTNVQLPFCGCSHMFSDHSVGVLKCLATILWVFTNVQLPFCESSSTLTYHSVGVPKCLPNILWVFTDVFLLLCWCSQMFSYHSVGVCKCLATNMWVFTNIQLPLSFLRFWWSTICWMIGSAYNGFCTHCLASQVQGETIHLNRLKCSIIIVLFYACFCGLQPKCCTSSNPYVYEGTCISLSSIPPTPTHSHS